MFKMATQSTVSQDGGDLLQRGGGGWGVSRLGGGSGVCRRDGRADGIFRSDWGSWGVGGMCWRDWGVGESGSAHGSNCGGEWDR